MACDRVIVGGIERRAAALPAGTGGGACAVGRLSVWTAVGNSCHVGASIHAGAGLSGSPGCHAAKEAG